MTSSLAIQLEAIRDRLDQAEWSSPAQIGHILIALAGLVNLVESLSERITDLERVQNERSDG